jgi:hypothetical protein
MAATPIDKATTVVAAFLRPFDDIDLRGGAVNTLPQFGQVKSSPSDNHTSRWVDPIQQPSRLVQRPGVRMMESSAPVNQLTKTLNDSAA